MDTLALSEWLTHLDLATMRFMLAIHTEVYICFPFDLKTTGYREEKTEAIKCSITWLTENYQHTTCWVCDHATCCVLLCFILQLRITLLFCPTGASGESKQNQMFFTSLAIRFSVEGWHMTSLHNRVYFITVTRLYPDSLKSWCQPFHWIGSLFYAFWANQRLILSWKKSYRIQTVLVFNQGTGLDAHPPPYTQ